MVAVNTTTAAWTPSAVGTTWAEQFWWQLLLAALASGYLLALWDDDWPLTMIVGIITTVGIIAARKRRVVVAVATAFIAMVLAVAVGEDLALLPLVSYACFYLASDKSLRTSIPVGAAIAVSLGVAVPLLDRERLEPLTVIGVLAVVLLPLLLGVVLQQQQQQLRAQVEAATASRLEQERLAIARDLHDVVAHGLTAVAIQSGTAVHLFESKPERAREALVNVNEAARAALAELRAMVGDLRSTDDVRPTGSDDPIAAAIERISPAMGVSTIGDRLPASTPSTVRIALERVTGEALANVIAHGGSGRTQVELAVTDAQLQLTIDNSQGPDPSVGGSTGFGIIGMTERIAVLGGRLDARPRPGGFTVTATIPRGDW